MAGLARSRQGRAPGSLSAVDPDARSRRPKPHKPAILGHKENLIVDKSAFILARQVTPANAGDVAGAEPLLERLPLPPKSLTGDSAYGVGAFREKVRRQGITRYAPLKETNQATASTLLATGARPQRLNETLGYQREMGRRKTVIEGVFARLDRLGWDIARLRGIDIVDCPGLIAAMAHNILKALIKLRFGKRAAGAKFVFSF